MMSPRFKGQPNFNLAQACPLCGYAIQPRELLRLASHIIRCPKCGEAFDELAGKTAEHVVSPAHKAKDSEF
ncbi:MAG TPA: hypothetical protein VMB49_21790 [Acidobacteriaceae bacterium]|nr:hypothetical protein [Acidobacteriaceae bacterium]